ncbi:MAG: hypothetical protein J5742_01285 [Alphaproteobacteria bacterium]|nr:hypothetical protein [Alphaproteobacteria bacterium]
MANTQTFNGDGNTTSFYFTFAFFGTNDIHVSINNVTQTSDAFTVYPNTTSGDAPDIPYTGGRIDFAVAPTNNSTIKVWRDIDLTRHIDYQPTAQLQSHQLNQDFNQCIEILKELTTKINNLISLATTPTLAELLSELTTIHTQLTGFVTTDNLTTLNDTVSGHTTAINTLNGYDYVVASQNPTAENNYTWYRKYKSGWVEQGGRLPAQSSATNLTVTMPIEMADNNYFITKQRNFGTTTPGSGSANEQTDSVWNLTTTTFVVRVYSSANSSILWEVKGIAATTE